MIRALAILVASGTALFTLGESAQADNCHLVSHTSLVNGHAYVQTVKVCDAQPPAPVIEEAIDADPPRDSDLDAICVATAISAGQDPFAFCDIPPDDPPEITPGLVALRMQSVPLPASVLEVQPPNGRTLVNFDTNFFTDARAFDRSMVLLGQRVDLHIIPSTFAWQFGDGRSASTTQPGSPYPDLDVTHKYLNKGQVAPRVDTIYTATWSLNGVAQGLVPGSVTIAGAPVDLEVLTATPTLVGYQRG